MKKLFAVIQLGICYISVAMEIAALAGLCVMVIINYTPKEFKDRLIELFSHPWGLHLWILYLGFFARIALLRKAQISSTMAVILWLILFLLSDPPLFNSSRWYGTRWDHNELFNTIYDARGMAILLSLFCPRGKVSLRFWEP